MALFFSHWDGDCNPTDNTKMLNPTITQEMMPNLTQNRTDGYFECDDLHPHRTSLVIICFNVVLVFHCTTLACSLVIL